MAYISIEIDEIEDDELIREVCKRIRLKRLSAPWRKALKEALEDQSGMIAILEIKTLEYEMKYEHFVKVFDKYTSSKIEQLLPE